MPRAGRHSRSRRREVEDKSSASASLPYRKQQPTRGSVRFQSPWQADDPGKCEQETLRGREPYLDRVIRSRGEGAKAKLFCTGSINLRGQESTKKHP
eukprot:757394-Hanusia_phi.AAC.10